MPVTKAPLKHRNSMLHDVTYEPPWGIAGIPSQKPQGAFITQPQEAIAGTYDEMAWQAPPE